MATTTRTTTRALAVFLFLGAFERPASPAVSIDFSASGYAGGGVSLPTVAAIFEVRPSGGDDTAAIQAAVDAAGREPRKADGFRGAVLLRPGSFRVRGQIRMRASGVVLRGQEATIVAAGIDRRTLIVAAGKDDRVFGAPIAVADEAVPAGSKTLPLASTAALHVGDRVSVRRPSTADWVHELGMDAFPGNFHDLRLDWLPGSRDLDWDRKIVAIDAAKNRVTLDAPITMALEPRFGGGSVRRYTWPGRLRHVGVENLILDSEFDSGSPGDEEHAWIAISLDHVEDAWVRGVTARHFVSSAVDLGPGARAVTVRECHSEAQVSQPAGWRRLSFLTRGQLVLFDRCTAEDGRHDFAVGHAAAGPTVFLQCTARRALGESGPIESWAAGVLYDQVRIEGADLVLGNRESWGQAVGWNAANSVVWNGVADRIAVKGPPTASNEVVQDDATPSLYRAQLAARLGAAPGNGAPPASPGPEPIKLPSPASVSATRRAEKRQPLAIVNGRLTVGGRALFGGEWSNAWWKGQMIPYRAKDLGVSMTRWAPGRDGPGLTEDLESLTEAMRERGTPIMQAWPGLWYDRRRDDHTTTTRADADVAGPFYEMPWARSGDGRASDGLARYDLTKFNPWYFERLRTFAAACARKGLVLVHHFYNNHNLIEAAAHWADFPWRPANCIQDTGFPEPPPFEENGSRIGVASIFYDVSHPLRRDLHRRYIRHGLDVFKDEPNVVHALAFQDTAPLGFQQFFLDTVAEWKRETDRSAHVALITGKNVADAILADPARAAQVDVVDLRYWQYLADGSLFAPPAGQNHAYREFRTEAFGKDAVPPTTAALVYRQVREYRDRFPEKAIVVSHAGNGAIPVLMAGGAAVLLGDSSAAQPFKPERDEQALLHFIADHLAGTLARMTPTEAASDAWCLSDGRDTYLFYSPEGPTIHLAPALDLKAFVGSWFDPASGRSSAARMAGVTEIQKPGPGSFLLLLERRARRSAVSN